MKNFYVYEHWRPDLDVCFYVGKGKGKRAYRTIGRAQTYDAVALALRCDGFIVDVRIVARDLTEKAAHDLERERIKFWRSRGVILANCTDGGEGFSGFIRPLGIRLSEATRAKVSAARKGIKFSEEHRHKLSLKKLGIRRKPFTLATIERMSIAAQAREQAKRDKHGDKVTRWSRLS